MGGWNGHYIVCINETNVDNMHLDLISVNPTSGDVVYNLHASDEDVLHSLETIFHVLKPCEIILPKEQINKNIEIFVESYRKNNNDFIRIERLAPDNNVSASSDECSKKLDITDAECDGLLGCIDLFTAYLRQFDLHELLISFDNYRPFGGGNIYMKLDNSTICNLELFDNNVNGQVKGSLFWILDHTTTSFGRRLLKRWLSEPLLDVDAINSRLDGITELAKNMEVYCIQNIKKQFHWMSDLEKGLTLIYHRKVTPEKFIKTLTQLEKQRELFLSYKEEISKLCSSTILVDLYKDIPGLLGTSVSECLNKLNKSEAGKASKENLFKDSSNYPAIQNCHTKIRELEGQLEQHRKRDIVSVLKNTNTEFRIVSGLEYLIEVKNTNLKIVPSDWLKICSTKQVTRFRTPYVEQIFKKLCLVREELVIASNEAWDSFLDEFSTIYHVCRRAVGKIAVFDCLFSLAIVTKQPNFCRPQFDTSRDIIAINDGRHPVIDALLGEQEQFVANDTILTDTQKFMLISGPNMGGKSSYIKQVALTCIMAQVGSYVPATSAVLSPIDGVYTRMGASDDIVKSRSTFLVELEEASRSMRKATSKSLVILDELGRGKPVFLLFVDHCSVFYGV